MAMLLLGQWYAAKALSAFLHSQNDNYGTLFCNFSAVSATHQAFEDPLDTEWFMQDAALPHRTEQVFSFLHKYFREGAIALDYQMY